MKKLIYEETVKIKNLLTYIKLQSKLITDRKKDINKSVDKINKILNKADEEDLISKKELLEQSRRVRNYSNTDEVYYAVPTKFIENQNENIK